MTTGAGLPILGGDRGFTLLEMLVVLAILAIVAVSASDGMSASIPALRLKAETRILADGLRAARRAAILQQHEASVAVMPDRYLSSDERHPHVLPAGTRLALSDMAEQGHQPESRIRFFADGSSTGGHIRLEMGERHGGVTVDWLTGRVAVDD